MNISAYLDLANQYQQNGNFDLAVENFLKALDIEPNNSKIYNELAITYYYKRDYEKALSAFDRAIKINPSYAMAYNNRGIIYSDLKQFEAAVENYKKAVELNPEYASAYNNLGNTYNNIKLYDEAIESYKKTLELNPNRADAYHNLGALYYIKKLYDSAVENYKKAIELNPSKPETYSNLGMVLHSMGRYSESDEFFNKSIELNPNIPETYYLFGVALYERRRFDMAMSSYTRAVELKPDYVLAYLALSGVYLLKGKFEAGWNLYESRFSKEDFIRDNQIPMLHQPRWNGEDLSDKTIYVYWEQGFGDTIMFSRYIPQLEKIAKKVIFKPQSCLKKLFENSGFKAELIDQSFPEEKLEFDVHSPLLSLPRLFKTDLSNIPFSEGYLKAEEDKINYFKNKYFDNNAFKVGIFWHGNKLSLSRNSVGLKYFYKFAELPNVKLYSLQKGEGLEQLGKVPANIDIIGLGSVFNDYTDTAAAIANLDVVITVDTSVAHLAGALGKPVWILLHTESEWRWLLDRDDSPWYKSVRLFRMGDIPDWEELFEQVCRELEILQSK